MLASPLHSPSQYDSCLLLFVSSLIRPYHTDWISCLLLANPLLLPQPTHTSYLFTHPIFLSSFSHPIFFSSILPTSPSLFSHSPYLTLPPPLTSSSCRLPPAMTRLSPTPDPAVGSSLVGSEAVSLGATGSSGGALVALVTASSSSAGDAGVLGEVTSLTGASGSL